MVKTLVPDYECLIFLVCSFLFVQANCSAQPTSNKPQRILFVLNASESMLQNWDNHQNRFETARDFILQLMDSMRIVRSNVEFGLRVYGHQYPTKENNCYDSKLEVSFSLENRVQMDLRLRDIKPKGLSTVAYALNECTSKDISLQEDYLVVLITDSPESCSKNFCPVAQKLREQCSHEPIVLTLLNDKTLSESYTCVGVPIKLTSEKERSVALSRILNIYRKKPAVKPAVAEDAYGYIKVSDRLDVKIVCLLYKSGNEFYPLPKSHDGIMELLAGKTKVRAGCYRVVYRGNSNDDKSKDFTVKGGMVTEVKVAK